MSPVYLSLQRKQLATGQAFLLFGNGLWLALVESGSGYVGSAGARPLLRKELLVVHEPREIRLVAAEDQPLRIVWFRLRFEHLLPLFAAEEIPLLRSLVELFRTPRIYPASSPPSLHCHTAISDIAGSQGLTSRALLIGAAAALLTTEIAKVPSGGNPVEAPEERLCRTLKSMPATALVHASVSEMSRRLGVSRRHLNRLIQTRFGQSFLRLKFEVRLSLAASLLCRSGIRVCDVAERSGFNRLSNFNKFFRRRFGVTPSQYRKQARVAQSSRGSTNTTWMASFSSLEVLYSGPSRRS